jgi:hypothetical protein
MGARCSACGFETDEEALFRSERGILPLDRRLCLACGTPEPWSRATLAAALWSIVTVALIVSLQLGADLGSAGYTWLVLVSFLATAPLAIAAHEAGHALAAVLVGRRIYVLAIGRGAVVATWCFGDLQVALGRDLGAGFIQAHPQRPEARWRTSLYFAGGAVANLTAAASVIALLSVLSLDAWGPAGECLASVAIGFAAQNVATAVLAIMPRQMKWGSGRLPSDGLRLIDLWRKRPAELDYSLFQTVLHGHRLTAAGAWRDARLHYAAALARAPGEPILLGCLVHVLGRDQGPAAAMAYYVEQQAAFEAAAGCEPSPQYGYAAGNVAWQALRTGDAAWLALADELSERAIAMDATSAPLRATRGAALITKGERETGALMLWDALRDVEDPIDKAEFCSFLAQDARRQGQDGMGSAFERLEAHLLTRTRPAA